MANLALVAIRAVALASFVIPVSDNPATAVQAEFQAAKAALAAGDLVSAETHYVDTISLGLRQLAQISLSLGETDQAATYLDSALKLNPGDMKTQVDAAKLVKRRLSSNPWSPKSPAMRRRTACWAESLCMKVMPTIRSGN